MKKHDQDCQCLYKSIGRSQEEYFELLTILSDIQRAINSQPLTYCCSSDSGSEIITCNCFLYPLSKEDMNMDDENIVSEPPQKNHVITSLEIRDYLNIVV